MLSKCVLFDSVFYVIILLRFIRKINKYITACTIKVALREKEIPFGRII